MNGNTDENPGNFPSFFEQVTAAQRIMRIAMTRSRRRTPSRGYVSNTRIMNMKMNAKISFCTSVPF
jgi:hypothetical protein